MPDSSIKQIMKEKLGELVSLDINKIQISEFNTRCQFIDEGHVKTLMISINEHGYIPKSAAWVNAVKGPDGKIITYRLVAGRHRYEASRRLKLEEIPCQLYYNLTDEEECALDEIDNKLDEAHKPVSFLATAEHYKYLRDMKGWSQRQIAKAKNVSRSFVQFRLKIANLSKEVKDFFRGGHPDGHLHEKYFQYICRLSKKSHHILICKEIIASNLSIEDGHKKFPELKSIPSNPMTQKNVQARVEELLAIEQEGKIAPEALQFTQESPQSTPVPVIEYNNETVTKEKAIETDIKVEYQEKTKNNQAHPQQLQFDIFSQISDTRIAGAKPGEFRFSILPMWIRHTDLINNMCSSVYQLLQELITYDFRYKPAKDNFFFIKHSSKYNKCTDFLAHIAGVKPATLHKKILPGLKDYVNYKKTDTTMKFQMKWNKLYEIYKKHAKEIPFDDGGLLDLPPDYTDWLRPTPFHSIYIENGQVKETKKENEQAKPMNKKSKKKKQTTISENKATDLSKGRRAVSSPENTPPASPLAQKLRELNMAETQIQICLKNRDTTANVLKYFEEMPVPERQKITKAAGYIYSTVKNGFKPPEGFVTVKEAEERKKKRQALDDFGTGVKKAYDNNHIKYFCPGKDRKYRITSIPNTQVFIYNKKGIPAAGQFNEWMDMKYFIE